MKKLLASAFSALAMVLGAASVAVGDVPGTGEMQTGAAGAVRAGWAPGPDGTNLQHNETLVRDR